MTILRAKISDSTGKKAEIEIIEFKTWQDAINEILKMRKTIDELQTELKEIKDGANNGK